MFTKMKRWFTNQDDKDRLAAIEANLATLHEQNLKLQQEKDRVAAEKQRVEAELEEYKAEEQSIEDKKNGIEPWVEITSANYDEIKGFRIELDWNEAFIQHLKESGLKGKTDEEVVQKWIGFLYGDLIEKLEQTSIEKSDGKPTNDFL